MKRIILPIILFVFYSTLLFAQWTAQNSGTTNNLTSVNFISANIGWAVGANGKILKTTNGGTNWTALTSGTTNQLNSVFFVSTTYGAFVGNGGLISVTLNGGDTWFPQATGYTSDFFDIFFTNSMTAYIVGDAGRILKSTDGGLTWLTQASGTTDPLWSVWFIDSNTGWAVGGSVAFGRSTILKTVDGGLNWVSQIEPTGKMFSDVTFGDSQNGWAVSETGTLIKTANGGTNWATQNSGTAVEWLYAAYAVNNQTAWVGGGGGYIANTINGGANWTQQASGIAQAIRGLYFIDGNTGWAVGDGGKILKYSGKSITVTSPNGGENWKVGTTQNITWTSSNVTNVKLEYSIDNGTSWTQIVASTAASAGSYSWTVPNEPSTNCKVRVSDAGDATVTDQSNAVFTIYTPTVTVISPNGGEYWKVGTNKNITWTSSNVTNVKLEYSVDNGSNWTTIIASTAANTGNYSWAIPNSTTSTALVRVTDTSDNTVKDQSDGNFTIYSQPEILSPNGGENWKVGTEQNIRWNSSLNGNVKLEYTTNNGSNWLEIVTNLAANLGSYSWTIPNTVTTQALVRIVFLSDNTIQDQSDAIFTIYNPTISITSPNGGENWKVGTTQNITWTSSNVTNVKLEYSIDNGTSWTQIVASTAASAGSYSWTVLNEPSTNCKVRVSDAGDATVTDQSNAVFTIYQPTVTVTSPNGGEDWKAGTTQNITWTSSNVTNVKLEYSIDNGTNWTQIVASTAASAGSYSWTVPNEPSANCKVRVSDAGDATINDINNNVFTIYSPLISVTHPNGSRLFSGSTEVITWTSTNVEKIKIEFSTNNGVDWILVVNDIDAKNNSYHWLVPQFDSENCLIKITDLSDPLRYGYSVKFSVSKPGSINLIQPNGGESLIVGTTYKIRWSMTNVRDVWVYLSSDNGDTWSEINRANTSVTFFDWLIPKGNALEPSLTSNYKLKVQGTSFGQTVSDISDLTFSIGKFQLASLKDTCFIGKNFEIKWDYWNLKPDLLKIECEDIYSGQSYTIANNVLLEDKSYSWLAPGNLENKTIRIKVFNSSNLFIGENIRTIIKKPYIKLNSLNSGQEIVAGSHNMLYWETNYYANVNIKFSGDGGTTWNTIVSSLPKSINSYEWIANEQLSTNCLIRIIDAFDSNVFDDSDRPFTIYKSSINITYPVNGNYYANNYNTIRWNSEKVNKVNIYYKKNNNSWVRNRYNIINLNSYSPNYNERIVLFRGDKCTYKIENTDDPTVFDTASFRIKDFKLDSPSGGEKFLANSQDSIKYSYASYNTDQLVDFYYSIDNMQNWNLIKGSIRLGDSSLLLWNVPDIYSDKCRIKISHYSSSEISQYDFTIAKLEFIKPLSNEIIPINQPYEIQWESKFINFINVDYSTDNGTTWNSVANRLSSINDGGKYSWNVPNQQIDQCKIRISDSEFPNVKVEQAVQLKYVRIPLILSPNGGENWKAGTTQNITWTSSNVIAVTLAYTTDNGTSWNTIISGIPAAPASYSWMIPNTPTTQAKIRVSNAGDATINDVSNNVFTISSLILVSPNGNENWPAGSSRNITWTSSNINRVKIEYSTNSGSSWNLITGDYLGSAQSFPWIIPNTPSNQQCIVRIIDKNFPSIRDSSDSFFTISSFDKSLTLTSPNGGELLQVGKEYEIKWSSYNINSVKLYVSTNGGGFWTYIGTSDPGSNSLMWTVIDHPSVAPSENCKIKIIDVENANLFDISEATFTICKYNLTSPIGGEQWQGGSSHQITWSYRSVYGKTKIELSIDNGTTWFVVKDSTNTSNGTSTITIPFYASEQCRARISLVNKPEINFTSPAVFTIYNVELLSPNNGETIRSGTTYEIKWNSFNMSSVRLEYSTDNGSNWVSITDNTTASANSYSWLVPNVSSSACKIRISNSSNRNQFAMNNGTFTMFIPTISVISPNGGEVFLGGSFRDIKWNASDARKVKLEYTFDNGRNWLVIEDSVLATPSSYSWGVPALNSSNCKIRITDITNNINDLSDNKFSITLTGVTIQSPNGSERWQSNTVHDITWISSNVTAVKIEFSSDNGVSWSVVPNGGNIPAELGTFSWTLPNISSLQCKVKVSSTVNANLSDQSDYTFSISSLVLTSPSSGDKWQGLTRHNITWTSTNITNVKLEYSTNNGSTWLLIIASTPASAGSFSWTLPDLHQTSCILKISDASNSNITSENNGVFAIYRYKLVLVSPNGNENWQAGKAKNITWNSYDVNQVKLYYSTDVGTTWSPIAVAINATDGNYPWTIPATLRSQNCLIKIVDNSNAAFKDSSDQKFTISSLSIISPNGGEILEADSTRIIRWDSANLGLVELEYTSNGTNWISIDSYKKINSTAGKYDWRLPNINSENYKVRIKSKDDPTIYDESNNFFTVTNEKRIDITSPIGGTIWYVNSPQVITWRSLNLEFVKISYSFDNGFSWNIISDKTDAITGTIGWIPVTPSLQNKIKIEGLDSREKTESTVFSVLGAPEITLSYPNGGENFESGNSALIQWSSSNVMNVKLQYRINARGNWEDIVSSVLAEDRQFNWTIPNRNSNECMIRAVCVENPATKDLSNNTFSIITKSADLISPNGGEMILAGSNYDIKWKKNLNTQDIAIEYSNNDGGRWIRIASNVNPNDESFNWNVPNISSSNCLVRIIEIIRIGGIRQVSVLDKSERKFLIYNQTEDQEWLVAEANNKKEKCYLTDDLGFGLEVEPGTDMYGTDRYLVKKTQDGGKNWSGKQYPMYIFGYAHLSKTKDNSAVIGIGPLGRMEIQDGTNTWYTNRRESFDASAAFFLNSSLGYIIGKDGNNEGKLLKTVDRGTSWTISSITDEKLDAIYFLNSDNGWVSANKKLYSTADGSSSWTMKDNSQLPDGISSIYFINNQKGFVTSSYVVYRTTDGGNNWLGVGFAPSTLTEIKFKNEAEGYAIGSSATMLHTIDGGNNWFTVNFPAYSDLVSFGWSSYDNPYVSDVTGKLYRIQQRKVNIITPIENAQIEDGNQFKITWDCTPNIDKIIVQFKQNGIPIDVNPSSSIDNNEFEFDAQDKSAILDLNFPTGKIDIYLMDALNKSRVYSFHSILVGNPSVNLWRVVNQPGTNDFQKVNNKTYRTSTDKLYSSLDNGLTWSLIYTKPSIADYSVSLHKLYFVNDNIGYMVSSEYRGWYGGDYDDFEKLLKTTDGGQTWTSKVDIQYFGRSSTMYPDPDVELIPFIYFLNENVGWINKWQQVGEDYRGNPFYGFKWCKTNDGGTTLTNMNYDWNPRVMQFIDQTTGFCLGDNDKIYKSTDRGNNWNLIKEGESYSGLYFLNSNYGFVVGGDGLIYKTTNGGNSWFSQYSGTQKGLSSIYLVNENIAYAAGSGIAIKTTNGGANWKILFDDYNATFTKVFCTIGDNVFLVANNSMLYSNTGGEPARVAKDIGDETPKEIPKNFSLAQNYPNPFNPTTTVQYELPTNSRVRINIYNILGQLVAELANEIKSAGYYKQVWNGSSLASGVYLLRIEAESLENSDRIVKSIKMLLVK